MSFFCRSLKSFIFYLLFSLPLLSLGQTTVYFKTTAGNYRMSSLYEFHALSLWDDPTSPKGRTDNNHEFSISVQPEAGIAYTFNHRYTVSLSANYTPTHCRMSAIDQVIREMKLKRVTIIGKFAYEFAPHFCGYLATGAGRSYISTKRQSPSRSQTAKTSASVFFVEPGAQWSKTFDRIVVTANLGYEFDTKSEIKNLRDLQSTHIHADWAATSSPVEVDWSGIRLGVSVGYALRRREQS